MGWCQEEYSVTKTCSRVPCKCGKPSHPYFAQIKKHFALCTEYREVGGEGLHRLQAIDMMTLNEEITGFVLCIFHKNYQTFIYWRCVLPNVAVLNFVQLFTSSIKNWLFVIDCMMVAGTTWKQLVSLIESSFYHSFLLSMLAWLWWFPRTPVVCGSLEQTFIFMLYALTVTTRV